MMSGFNLFFNLIHINMGHGCILTVEDLGQLYESRSASLDVEEVDEEKLNEDPDLVGR
jgi:hypothetical protein